MLDARLAAPLSNKGFGLGVSNTGSDIVGGDSSVVELDDCRPRSGG